VTELLAQFSAFTVFLAIAAVGFLFLLVSLVFGELFEHFGDGHFDHDFSHGGPSFFSIRILSVFVTAFGGFGAVGIHYGLSTPASSGVGFLSGLFFASLIYTFARFLFGQQATTEVRSADLVGRMARVVVAIPAGGVGQVRCQVGEELIDQTAQTRDGSPLAENTIVTVEEVLGDTCIVRPK
jgi:membrane protein implicated in regulation of membrane protease activity